MELVDMQLSKSCAERRVGPTPTLATHLNNKLKLRK